MNWTNYDRLVEHLKKMEPSSFSYGNPCPETEEEASCVACQVRLLSHGRTVKAQLDLPGPLVIQQWMEVTQVESVYLFGRNKPEIDSSVRGDGFESICGAAGHGDAGIREALRRLAVVAARYGRPSEQPPPSSVGDDAAFLASVRALIHQPLVEIE